MCTQEPHKNFLVEFISITQTTHFIGMAGLVGGWTVGWGVVEWGVVRWGLG